MSRLARVFSFLFLITALAVLPASPAPAYSSGGGLMLEEIIFYLHSYHIDSPEEDELVNGAIQGMLDVVEDPHTKYFTSEEMENFKRSLDGDLSGIGVEITPGSPYPTVTSVLPGSPAEKAGLRAGDLITAVDGTDLSELTLLEAVNRMRGPKGTSVKLTVNRAGVGNMTFSLVREHIDLPTVHYRVLEDKTGYIYLGSFGTETGAEFKTALANLLQQEIKYLVLDLRNNGGGYMQSAVDVASAFLPAGSEVLSVVDKSGRREKISTTAQPVAADLPLAVLVNRYSASAAEILPAALKDHHRAILVGEPTYGKGVLQSMIPLESGGALKLTTHRCETPSGIALDGRGILPDREVLTPQLQLAVACDLLQGNDKPVLELSGDGWAAYNGREIECPYPPLDQGGVLYLPLRFTLEAMGFTVGYSKENITITGRGQAMKLRPGQKKALLNGVQKTIDGAVKVEGETSYLPGGVLELLNLEIERQDGKVRIFLPVSGH